MKKVLKFLLIATLIATSVFALIACGDKDKPNTPTQLSTPVVVLNENVACWQEDLNADKFEISLSGNLSYVENTITSKVLTQGQTLKVRAIGDGNSYKTSEWSNTVTYTGGSVNNPIVLEVPVVNISSLGIASWGAVANASGYIYKINDGVEIPTNTTSVQLSLNQNIVVKAIGDGVNYSNSGWSVLKSYTQSTQAVEPQYLGIFASVNEPKQSDGLPNGLQGNVVANTLTEGAEYRSFEDMLKELYLDEDNYLGATYPKESNYDVYSSAESKIYIQIWLDNPSQYTILSLKLNGVKHQIGGELFSFFIQQSGVYYNCLYVAVTIPSHSYIEKEYVVSEIEYVEGTYINADGTDTFMNENDTVNVGLLYSQQNPTVTNYAEQSVTVNGCSVSFTFSDADNLLGAVGGWAGVAIVDTYKNYKIMSNQKVSIGENVINVSGLEEDFYYSVIVYLYADLHDGYGVRAHYIARNTIYTPKVLNVNEIEGVNVLNENQTGYVGAINVDVSLNSNTAEFTKLEIVKDGLVVYTDNNFNGKATVTNGVLNKSGYDVRVYYKDNEYPQGKYYEGYVFVAGLNAPSIINKGSYTFVNDAIYYFSFDSLTQNQAAINGFVARIYDDSSARYIAQDVISLIDNPNIIDELWGEWYDLREELSNYEYGSKEYMEKSEEHNAIHKRIESLNTSKNTWENDFNSNEDRNFWVAEQEKGKYHYEYTYLGVDNQNVQKINDVYYLIIRNVFADADNYKMDIIANVALNESTENNGISQKDYYIIDNTLNFVKLFDNNVGVSVKDTVSLTQDKLTLTLYNSYDPRLKGFDDSTSEMNLRYIYKIQANDVTLYVQENESMPIVDEDAWIAEYISCLKAGNLDVVALYKKYVANYVEQTITLDYSNISAGEYDFIVYTRKYNKTYEEDDYDGSCRLSNMEVYKQFETPNLRFEGVYGYVTISKFARGENIVLDAYDKNGNSVTCEIFYYSENTYRFEFAYQGAKARVKLSKESNSTQEKVYWIDSQWTEYENSTAIALEAPVFNEPTMQYGDYTLTWQSGTNSEYVLKYYYVIGDEESVSEGSYFNLRSLYQSCQIKVKAVASDIAKEAGYCDSDWATYNYTYQETNPDKKG